MDGFPVGKKVTFISHVQKSVEQKHLELFIFEKQKVETF